jgi:hypothetical protein
MKRLFGAASSSFTSGRRASVGVVPVLNAIRPRERERRARLRKGSASKAQADNQGPLNAERAVRVVIEFGV